MSDFRNSHFRSSFPALLCVLAYAAPGCAQTTTWAVPGSGFVLDAASQSIRPVSGFVGAATLGAPVLDSVEWASIAPNQKSALVERGRLSLSWIPDLGNPQQAQPIGRVAAIRQAFWAADTSRAVVLTRGSQLVWLNNFLPASVGAVPGKLNTVRLDALVPAGDWRLLAADRQADRVLLAVDLSGSRQLWTAASGAAPSRIPFSGNPAAAAFTSSGSSAYLADSDARQMIQINGLDAAPSIVALGAPADLVKSPGALVLSADDTTIFLADSATGVIHILSAADGSLLSDLPADAPAGSVTAVTTTRFQLNPVDRSAQPLLFLETTNPARVLFVPRGN